MNKNNMCLILGLFATILSVTALVVGIIPSDRIDTDEYQFLKAFATSYIDENDPDWECKKTVGLYELAKQDYPYFEKNTKWLADKHCGFDVSIITP